MVKIDATMVTKFACIIGLGSTPYSRLNSTPLLAAGMALHILLLLMHKTLGGWQFGARYLCDVIPMMLLYCVRWRDRTAVWEYPIMIFAVAFNIYGAACFHLMQGGY